MADDHDNEKLDGDTKREVSLADTVASAGVDPLAATRDSGSGERGTPSRQILSKGAAVGRYLILELLGEGGMGEVYTAYDPELDRRVALKLVHRMSGGTGGTLDDAQARLLKEARAMARLSHPNVVSVYDVGIQDGDVYIAMELIAGRSLSRWLREAPRDWQEILDRFLPAARGLAAAHAAGVVHRDFKPDNVLVGTDGRVRVIDFGIAHRESVGSSGDDGGERPVVLGTPSYMAPEQFRAEATDARTDQFNFCASLYEALWETTPFGGKSILELMHHVTEGKLRKPPSDSKVPARLRDAVLRGLAVAPDERYESMDRLIEALTPEPAPRRSRALAFVAIASVLAVGGVATSMAINASRDATCQGLDAHLSGIWDGARRQAVEDALRSTPAFDDDTWRRVRDALDQRAARWVSQRTDACEATHVRAEQTPHVMELRMACLDRRLAELDATLGVLESADADITRNASRLLEDLPPLDRCEDVDALLAQEAHQPPPEREEAVNDVLDELAKARALQDAARYEPAAAAISDALEAAESLDYDPLTAQVLTLRARNRFSRGDVAEALEDAFEGVRLADRGGNPLVEAEAWNLVVFLTRNRGENQEAERWLRHAEAALQQAGGDPILSAQLEVYRGHVVRGLGREADALEAFERARDQYVEAFGPDHYRVGMTLGAIASTLSTLGRNEESFEVYRQAVENLEASLGLNHPNVGITLTNLGNALRRDRRFEEARTTYQRALQIKEATVGPDNPSTAFTLINLGQLEQELGDYDAAEALIRRALEIRLERLGESHGLYASALGALSSLALARGDTTEGLELARRVLTLEEARGDSVLTARRRGLLAYAALLAGEFREAAEEAERSLEVLSAEDVEPEILESSQTVLGHAWVELGRAENAIPLLETAHASRTGRDVAPELVGFTELGLGRALFESRRDRARGRQLVVSAAAKLEEAGPPGRIALATANEWLSRHPEE